MRSSGLIPPDFIHKFDRYRQKKNVFSLTSLLVGVRAIDEVLERRVERPGIDTLAGAGADRDPHIIDEALERPKILRNYPSKLRPVTICLATRWSRGVFVESNHAHL